jgi:ferritin
MEAAINEQINAELYSAYLYLSMASWCHSLNLNGFANWMQVQVQEENFHAMKMYDFVNDRGGRVILKAIKAPETAWKSPLAVFEAVYKHEQLVTGLISKLVDIAISEKDKSSESFLQWFVDEQVEEEASADDIIQQIKLAGETGPGLFMIDRELAQRVFTPPAAAAE